MKGWTLNNSTAVTKKVEITIHDHDQNLNSSADTALINSLDNSADPDASNPLGFLPVLAVVGMNRLKLDKFTIY